MSRNILITPYRNDPSFNPRIDFVGASTGTIHLEVMPAGDIAFIGDTGTIFSVSDDVSASLTVNKIKLINPPIDSSDAINKLYFDTSLGLKANLIYVDNSISVFSTNTSVGLAFNSNASLGLVFNQYSNASLGLVFNQYANASLGYAIAGGKFYIDGSIANFATNASVNTAFIKNTSLGYLSARSVIFNASIGAINTSLNDTLLLSSYVNTSSYYDGSLNDIRSKISVSTNAPISPKLYDLWIDISII